MEIKAGDAVVGKIVLDERIPKGEAVLVDPVTGQAVAHIVGIDVAEYRPSQTHIHELGTNLNGDLFPASGKIDIKVEHNDAADAIAVMEKWMGMQVPKPVPIPICAVCGEEHCNKHVEVKGGCDNPRLSRPDPGR